MGNREEYVLRIKQKRFKQTNQACISKTMNLFRRLAHSLMIESLYYWQQQLSSDKILTIVETFIFLKNGFQQIAQFIKLKKAFNFSPGNICEEYKEESLVRLVENYNIVQNLKYL